MIQFSLPHIKQEAIDEVADTLRSGWITTGTKTKKFESEITKYCGNSRTLCVSSGTFGLEIILRWFGVEQGDEVILPVYTYCATANVIVHTGATPVMVDVNSDNLNISVSEIVKAITEKTKVIIPVDLAGLPVDYDKIFDLVKSHEVVSKFHPESKEQKKLGRILVLSDAAHSFGAEYKGKKAGTFADVSAFSFHAVKNITTGEGGAIALNLPEPFDNKDIYDELNTLSLHGQSKDALAKIQKGNWQYDVTDAGFKGNMTDIQASLGLVALKYYDSEMLPRRKKIMSLYDKAFKQYQWATTPVIEDGLRRSSYHVYMLRINGISEKIRNEIIQMIFSKDVSVNVHFKPLPLFYAYSNRNFRISDYPIAYKNYACEISLPVYYDLTDNQVQEVIRAVVVSVERVTR